MRKGFTAVLVIILAILIIAAGGFYFIIANRRSARQLQPATTTNSTQDENSSTENEKAIDVATNFLKALQTDNYDEAKKESNGRHRFETYPEKGDGREVGGAFCGL